MPEVYTYIYILAIRKLLLYLSAEWRLAPAEPDEIEPAEPSFPSVLQGLDRLFIYQVGIDDAGVVLETRNVPGAWLTVPAMHLLLGCAYSVAGASLP